MLPSVGAGFEEPGLVKPVEEGRLDTCDDDDVLVEVTVVEGRVERAGVVYDVDALARDS